jgi:ATP-dependent exoDNAse (exonuclease V) alpha subunit
MLTQLETGRFRFHSGDVLIVDEVGMMGTRTLAALVEAAHRSGAKTILVGDHKQLPEIEAGGVLAALVERAPVVELTQNRRQQDPGERFVVQALRQGLAELAVRRLDDMGHVTVAHNSDALRDQLVLDWWSHRTEGRDVLMGAAHRSDARDLNARAHALLEASGHVGPVVVEVDDTRLCVGDEVITLKNRYDIGILNGDVGVVLSASENSLRVQLENGEQRNLPLDYVAEHVAHAYARTVHKNQGLTCQVGLVLADDTLYAEMGYTALTRGSQQNRLYAMVSAHDLDQDGGPLAHVVRSLQTSRAKTAAIDLMEGIDR